MLAPNYRWTNGDLLATFTGDVTFRTCCIFQASKSYGRDLNPVLATFVNLYGMTRRSTYV